MPLKGATLLGRTSTMNNDSQCEWVGSARTQGRCLFAAWLTVRGTAPLRATTSSVPLRWRRQRQPFFLHEEGLGEREKIRTKGTPVAAAWSGGRGESNTTRAVFLGFHR
jgi:hypothetical protein